MDEKNIKLANILFPDVNLTVEECFNAYPNRVLPIGAEVTRIAPSPTGFLHIGTIYGAFIDKLLALHTNGVFYLRLEDTDSKREIKDSGDIFYEMLCTFGLEPDEGYRGSLKKQVGAYGDYVQSKRQNIYLAFAKRLVELGRAFPCFCKSAQNKKEILKRREEQIKEENDIKQKDVCRDLSLKEIEKNIRLKKPFALRLRSEGDGEETFIFFDKIKKERVLRKNAKDIIVLKSDKTPPYSLAHIVDDTLMGTTTVVRGEEWFASLPSHLELFKAFGFKPPEYAHTPVVCKLENNSKRKLSKRKDKEADAKFFIKEGYPVSSVMEYLLNLINSDFEDWRKQNPTASYYDFPFDISKINTSNPMFDFKKLDDCSKQVISQFSPVGIYENVLFWAKDYDIDFFEKIKDKRELCLKLFSIDRLNCTNIRKDIAKWKDVYSLYFYVFDNLENKQIKDFEFDLKIDVDDSIKILKEFLKVYSKNDDKKIWFDKLKAICPGLGFADNIKEYKKSPEKFKGSVADVSSVIRVALTSQKNTPDLYEILKLFDQKEIEKRLNYAEKILKKTKN